MDHAQSESFRTVRGYQLANPRADHLTPALEDYLEMIYRICLETHYVRVGKLSEMLHVKPSSASKMVLRLMRLEYVAYDCYDSILLTEKGLNLGAYLLHRHEIAERFLAFLGNPNPLEEAELIEHALTPETVARLQAFLSFFSCNEDVRKRYERFQAEKNAAPPNAKPKDSSQISVT